MIKQIILPLNIDTYRNNLTFNLLAYYKNVLKFSGDIVFNIEKKIEDINVSFLPLADVCFFNNSIFESTSRYFAQSSGDDDDFCAFVSNNIIIQKFNLDKSFDGYLKFESKIIGTGFSKKINPELIILKKKVWSEIYSFYDIFKNNFTIYNKINQKMLFEKILGALNYKIKNINKLEFMKYNIDADYLNSQIIFNYHKPNYLYFPKGILRHRQIKDILFDPNKDLVYSWREFCGEFI